MKLSASVVGWQREMSVSPGGSHVASGARVREVLVSFGDGSRTVLLHSLRGSARHRYARPGAHVVTLTLIDSAGHVSITHRRVIVTTRLGITPRRGTLVMSSDHVLSAINPPGLSSTIIILRAGRVTPKLGRALVIRPGQAMPEGFLGVVRGVSRNTNRTFTVTATAASLASAYSIFSVSVANQVREDGVYLLARDPDTGRMVARPANASSLPFTCQTSGGWAVNATADFSHTYVLATLDIHEPAMAFQFTTRPILTLGVNFQGSASCTLRNSDELQINVPIAAPLTLTIKPVFELSADGSFTAQATWTPRLTVGFDRAPGLSDNVIAFGSGLSFQSTGQANADIEDYLSIELGLGGRVGVTGTIGPHLHAALTESSHNSQATGCATVNAWLHADLTADADIFIRHWSWTLYSGDFYKTLLYSHCVTTGSAAPTPTPVTPVTASGGSSGATPSSGGTSGGGSGSGGSPGSGGSGSSGGSAPPTWAETTGGVTHTWTNYTNAGGTEGPSIPSNATVQIACKIPGFKVADGNTWWYRIASGPWSGNYYASADAFYNNGRTSGSLIGTPFVDPNVANC
jgi:uncharacterized membrane protein YgcG